MKRQFPTQPTPKTMKRQCLCCNKQTTSETLIIQHEYDEDKISQLPEPILHHILSFLPTFDATKTSTLSKAWNNTWKSFPFTVLTFSQCSFQGYAFRKAHRQRKPITFKKAIQDFTDFIDNSINRFDGGDTNMQSFQLQVDSNGFQRKNNTIVRWLNYAINKNVQRLDLDYYMDPKAPRRKDELWTYIMPQSIFRARSLKTLNLFCCTFIQSGLNSTGIGFSLKKLSLTRVYIDQNTLQTVISSSCCLLEELAIKHCTGFKIVKISGLCRLEKADLYLTRECEGDQIVALEAPNLRAISYGGGFRNVKGSIEGSRFEKIKQVLVHEVWIGDELFRVISDQFGSLEKMTLKRCNIFISIPSNIKHLDLSICDCFNLSSRTWKLM